MNLARVFTCLLLVPVAACSHSSASPQAPSTLDPSQETNGPATQAFAASRSGAADMPPPPMPNSAAGLGRDSASTAAPSSRDRAADERRAEKQGADDRPGLGTTWGETRQSYVSSAPFERADAGHPFAVLSLNYNDSAGIQAMARRMGNAYANFDGSGVDAAQGAVSVRLLDDSGVPLPSAHFGNRDYVAGADGQRYVIQIENHTGNRFEAVATVDGLDVVDGKDGAPSKRGYLIDPWATLQIDGFRRSQAAVAAFRFGAVKDSYAALKGNDRNVGVIGVAFFHERGTSLPWTERELQRRDAANPFPGGFAAPPPVPLAR